ncbi:MAG: response regulator transcription factor [Archangium sp.]|nr:response regulator transcription factor [Archangium sp.]
MVTRALEADGHRVSTATDLASAKQALEGIELVVLDLGLPDGSGLELCRWLREEGSRLPVLLLTAQSQVSNRVEGLDSGADDFLAKPFAVAELRARVRALGRRASLPRGHLHVTASIRLDFGGRRATRDGATVALTAREWAILELLAGRAGRVVSRADLLDAVWGDSDAAATNSLEVLIGRLRRKLGADSISTQRGEGYSLVGGRTDG